MTSIERIDRLCGKFEKDAQKIGYTLEGVVLLDIENDRIQINWNDKADDYEKSSALEGLALCLCMMAEGDKAQINDALNRAYCRTPQGSKQFTNLLAETFIDALGQGMELGRQKLKQLQSQSPGLPIEETEQIEGAKE